MDPNSAVLGQKELPGLCEHHRKHSPPASALSRCHGNQPFKTRQVASNSSLVQKALLLVRGTVFRFQHFPFLSKLNDVEIFGAGKPRLSGLSPIPVDGMDYICHLCPRIDSFFFPQSAFVILCMFLVRSLILASLNARLLVLRWRSWKRQHKQSGLQSLGYVFRQRRYSQDSRKHSTVKCREKFISLVQASFALF